MKEGFRRNYQNKRTPWLPRNPTKKAEEAEHGVWSAALAAAPPAGIPGPPSPWRCRARPRCCYRGLLGARRASSEGLGGGERREEWFSSAPPPTFTPNPERSGLGGGRWSSWEVRWLLAGGSFPGLLKGKKKSKSSALICGRRLFARRTDCWLHAGLGSPAPLSFYEAAYEGAVQHLQVCAFAGGEQSPLSHSVVFLFGSNYRRVRGC